MFKNIKISKFQLFFLFLVVAIVFEGWFCKFSAYRTHAEGSICQKYLKNFWNENGFVETLQVIFLLCTIYMSTILSFKSKIQFEKFFLITITFALFYYLGEEISWGQHYLNFKTPELLNEINNQKEFNLHNISNLFDQLPRAIVLVICSTSFVFFLINKKFFIINEKFNYLILPNLNLIFISFLLIFVSFPDFIDTKLNLQLSKRLDNYFYELITLNFIRLSELQELIFTFYFLNYIIFLKKKISS